MVTPSKGARPHHITLTDKDSGNEVPLRLLRDEQDRLMYEWTLAPALAPTVLPADVSYAQYTPDLELSWGQEDWSGGALAFYFDPTRPNMYGLSDKVWAATPNELSLGYSPKEVSFGVKNGGAQLNATTGWSASGLTLTAVTTAPHAGPYHFNLASTDANDYIQQDLMADDQVAQTLQSQTIVVDAYVRGSVAGGNMRVQIVETGGSSTPTTNGTAVTLTTSYQLITVTVALQSDSTAVNIRIECSSGSSLTVFADSINMYAGTAIPNASHCRMIQLATNLIAVTDRAVWQFNEDEDYWALQKVHDAAITGFEIYDDRLYVGQGESAVYEFSGVADIQHDGSDPWVLSNLGGTDDNANRFIKVLNANGNWALAKTLDDDKVHLATDPTNSGAWGSAIEVGKDDHDILQVFELAGAMAVGKEDGFYRYLSQQGNRFENVWPGALATVDADNFTRGINYGNHFYTIIGETGFWRYDGVNWESLEHVIQSPGFDDLGNRVRAFGTDGQWLYLIVEDLNADSITKECWLLMLKEFRATGWVVHTLCKFVTSDTIDITVHKPSGGTNRFLYINGDVNDKAFTHRIQLPNRTNTPRLATNKDLALSGSFTTSFMDWNRPQVEKAVNRYSLISESLKADAQSVTVLYQQDDETSFTNINATSSIFTAGPRQTIAVNEGVNPRRIRFRLDFATDDAAKTAVVKGTVVDTTWRPQRLKRWNIVAALEDRVIGQLGVPSGVPISRQLVRLSLLKDEVSPLRIRDIDGTLHRGHIIDMAETQYKVHPGEAALRYGRAVRLTLAQALAITAEPWDSGIRWDEFPWG
jgi:hypothetical protein